MRHMFISLVFAAAACMGCSGPDNSVAETKAAETKTITFYYIRQGGIICIDAMGTNIASQFLANGNEAAVRHLIFLEKIGCIGIAANSPIIVTSRVDNIVYFKFPGSASTTMTFGDYVSLGTISTKPDGTKNISFN